MRSRHRPHLRPLRRLLTGLTGLAVLATLAVGGCAGPGSGGRTAAALADVRDYRGLFEERLARAPRSGTFRVRANPVGCGCPAFEVELGGRWVRAAVIEGETVAVEALVAGVEATPRATFRVEGELGGELLPCGRAALYVTLEVNLWTGPEAEEP